MSVSIIYSAAILREGGVAKKSAKIFLSCKTEHSTSSLEHAGNPKKYSTRLCFLKVQKYKLRRNLQDERIKLSY